MAFGRSIGLSFQSDMARAPHSSFAIAIAGHTFCDGQTLVYRKVNSGVTATTIEVIPYLGNYAGFGIRVCSGGL